jgi:uncharacterized protein
MAKLLINLTTAEDNPDKSTVAFVVANAGIASGQDVAIFLNIEGVRLATPGYADTIAVEGFKPLQELMTTFTEGGGQLWVCPPCFNSRGLDKENVVAGAIFAGGAKVVEFLAEGAASLSY